MTYELLNKVLCSLCRRVCADLQQHNKQFSCARGCPQCQGQREGAAERQTHRSPSTSRIWSGFDLILIVGGKSVVICVCVYISV